MMLILQGIMDEPPPFDKYWTHMLQNESMTVVGDCQIKILSLSGLRIELFSPEYEKKKTNLP